MFYSYFSLSKNGPLSRVWLAAHWEKKLTKATVCGVSVRDAVDEVKKPNELALRTTGHLLLGIVRIYAKQTKFLLNDAGEVVLKLKANFRPAKESIVLEDNDGHLEDPPLPRRQRGIVEEVASDEEDGVAVSRPADITMNEEEVFDFDDRRSRSRSENIEQVENAVAAMRMQENEAVLETSFRSGPALARAGSLFGNEDGSFRFEAARDGTPRSGLSGTPHYHDALLQSYIDDAPYANLPAPDDFEERVHSKTIGRPPFGDITNTQPPLLNDTHVEMMDIDQPAPVHEISTFVARNAEPESFALEPLNTSDLPVRQRARKQRRLIVDTQATISDEEIRKNCSDFQDTLRSGANELAPPTRKLMEYKQTTDLNHLMANPGSRWMFASQVRRAYTDQLQLGMPPEDSDETLLSGHLRNEMAMANGIEESRPTTPMVVAPIIEEPQATPVAMDQNMDEWVNTPLNQDFDAVYDLPSAANTVVSQISQISQVSSIEKKDLLGKIVLSLRSIETDEVKFSKFISEKDTRKSAARKFFAILEAGKNQEVKLRQEEPFGEIYIRAGVNFLDPSPMSSSLS